VCRSTCRFVIENKIINPRLFGTELRMTDQVKHLGVILDKKLDWKVHLENGYAAQGLHCILVVSSCCGTGFRDYNQRWWPGYILPW
jgi:hypothetical protein